MMATLQINFNSKCLQRNVVINAIIPVEQSEEVKPFPTLYLLHGYGGNHNDWMNETKIQAYANKHRLAVIMPCGENKFYLDDRKTNELYGQFITEELVDFTRNLFPLSHHQHETFIGGLSMGGYGALINGLKASDTFGAIIALSSALIIPEIANMAENHVFGIGTYDFYVRVFGKLDELIGSERDPEALLLTHLKDNKAVPRLYMACGTEDFLIQQNRRFVAFLEKHNIQVTYIEASGAHEWDFWDSYIKDAIEWL